MLYSASPAPVKTYASETVGRYGDSDFLQAVSGMAPARAWEGMDELMDSLKIVNERVYNSVMRKLEKKEHPRRKAGDSFGHNLPLVTPRASPPIRSSSP